MGLLDFPASIYPPSRARHSFIYLDLNFLSLTILIREEIRLYYLEKSLISLVKTNCESEPTFFYQSGTMSGLGGYSTYLGYVHLLVEAICYARRTSCHILHATEASLDWSDSLSSD